MKYYISSDQQLVSDLPTGEPLKIQEGKTRLLAVYYQEADRIYRYVPLGQGLWIRSEIQSVSTPDPMPEKLAVGVDLGANPVITLSTGDAFYTPRYIIRTLRKIQLYRHRLWEKVRRHQQPSRRQLLLRRKLKKAKRDLSRQVHQFFIVPLRILAEYQWIRIERLPARDPSLWLAHRFVQLVLKRYPDRLVIVDPHGNSQRCPTCHRPLIKISRRLVCCSHCQAKFDRDRVAAINILDASASGGFMDGKTARK